MVGDAKGHQARLVFGHDAEDTDNPAPLNVLTAWAPEQWSVVADWQPLVKQFFASSTGATLGNFVRGRLAVGATVYPSHPLRALELTPLSQAKVVIFGQDPYHGPGQAQGLAFSVSTGVRLPPSLRNIFKEIRRDPALGPNGPAFPVNGSLTSWATQGVLLINTCLTVEEGQPASHAKQGWEVLAREVVQAVAAKPEPVVFMLWGAHAQAMGPLIEVADTQSLHLILKANHPSPLSALRPPHPFIGCGHFSLANAFLVKNNRAPIDWKADSLHII